MKSRLLALFLAALCLPAQTTIDVGSGASDPVIAQQFVNAFFRNGFSNLVSTPPIANVRSFGSTGLIQEFNDAAKTSGVRLALVKPNTSTVSVEGVADVFQMQALLYAHYSSVGVGTAGFPTMDTATCPNAATGTCYWQAFSKNYALFAYATPLANGSSTFTTKDPFYTEWLKNGGIATFGPATSAETAVTSPAGSVATTQTFLNGIILNITSGTLTGRLVSVRNPVYAVYASNGGPAGFLGLPTGPEQLIGTKWRQAFEGGSIEYEPGQGGTLRLPVTNVNLSTSVTTLRLKLGETFSVEAIPRSATGESLLDRGVSWVTTNGRVVTIQATGRTAILKAVGGGVATITAVSEGKISAPIAVSVQAPCCQIGEGAPTPATAQAFNDAITRNRLAVTLPGPSPVRRVASGYQQEFSTTAGARVVVALPDRSAQAWILTGALLTAFEQAGGAAGPVGYPAGDPTATGRQLFEGGALAGAPVRLVSGGILARWALLNYESGAVGPPVGVVSAFTTFAATAGLQQPFRDGLIVQVQSGLLTGRSLVVAGLIQAKYQAAGGPSGAFGAPADEEFTLNGRRRQNFEGGYMEYTPGSGVVDVVESARKPAISVQPSSAVAGSRIRLAMGGFADNATVRVSVTGQADFVVKTVNGSYAWDAWVPAEAASGTVTVRAVAGATVASTTYTVRAAAEARPRLTKVRGDAQSGAPGTRLPIPLRVNLRDESGSPLVGVAVAFAASPGADVTPRVGATDINGDAEAVLRLPSGAGIALATAEAARQVVTFSAQVSGTNVSNFPKISFEGNSYVGSAAAILKYFQDRGELTSAAGTVTAAALDSYLRNFCVLDSQANQICDGYLANPEVPNLWRLVNFSGGGLEILPIPTTELGIREALAGGAPVLVSMRLNNGTAAAAAAAVVTGAGADGGLQIMDPNPRQPRASLADYLGAGATIAGAARFSPRAAVSSGFLMQAYGSSVAVAGPGGACGAAFGIPGAEATSLFAFCDGSQSVYQAEIAASGAYRGTMTDLGSGGPRYEISGLRNGAFRVSKPALYWELAALEPSIEANAVVNAASFTADYAPGTIVSIFGLGLARANRETTVEIGGQAADVLYATPFQVNAVVPLGLTPGSWPLRLTSGFGVAETQAELRDAAPAVFRLSETQAAVTNQNGSLNAPNNPAARGQVVVIYGTGFGAVEEQAGLRRTVQAVGVRGAGLDLPVVYSGLTPGYIGLYQLNVQLPADMPPGLFQALEIRQGGVTANPVVVAIR